MCEICKVSRSGYYNWLNSSPNRANREAKDVAAFLLIKQAYEFKGFDKGAYGIHMRLLHMGIRMNVKKIRRLMKKYGLYCPIRRANPYRQMARNMRTNSVADNHLKREFRLHGPRKILLTDITYIPYAGKFCYLSAVKDAYTKEILSYVLSESLELPFVLDTFTNLMETHPEVLDSDVLVHSDQGCHYTAHAFQELLKENNILQSMSRRGNCWDNAPQESFFGHMKDELKKRSKSWKAFEQVKLDVDEWMDYYNNDRGQWQLEKLSPSEFYIFTQTGINPLKMIV